MELKELIDMMLQKETPFYIKNQSDGYEKVFDASIAERSNEYILFLDFCEPRHLCVGYTVTKSDANKYAEVALETSTPGMVVAGTMPTERVIDPDFEI